MLSLSYCLGGVPAQLFGLDTDLLLLLLSVLVQQRSVFLRVCVHLSEKGDGESKTVENLTKDRRCFPTTSEGKQKREKGEQA